MDPFLAGELLETIKTERRIARLTKLSAETGINLDKSSLMHVKGVTERQMASTTAAIVREMAKLPTNQEVLELCTRLGAILNSRPK